ncbi:MAG: hypothetical protein U9Q07_03845 [Planctomycetota bacterium]|nr:hypothetical protein [Planctomycetota bacterium]
MSKKKVNGQKETLRERLAKAESERDAANRRAKKAERDLKIEKAKMVQFRDDLRTQIATSQEETAHLRDITILIPLWMLSLSARFLSLFGKKDAADKRRGRVEVEKANRLKVK